MSESYESRIGHELVERIIDKRMEDARKAEVLLIYEDLLQAVWDRILPTLGRVTTIAIMERAIVLAREHYPVIGKIQIGANGVLLEGLKESIEVSEPDIVRAAFKELVAAFIDILAMLTGDILVKQVIKEIEERRSS
jgi:hypothetical protein